MEWNDKACHKVGLSGEGSVGWTGVEWSGVQCNVMDCNEVEWNGTKWNGMGNGNGMEWTIPYV